jgi:hypothetical protein
MELKALTNVLATWIFIFILIPVVIAFIFRSRQTQAQRAIFALCVFALVFQILSYFTWKFEIVNLPFLHVYTPVELVLIVFFFKTTSTSKSYHLALNFVAIAFSVFAILNVVFFQSIYEMNAPVRGVESLIVMTLCILLWLKIMRELKIERLISTPVFWFNTAFLGYFSVNFILFIFSNDLNKLAVEFTIQPWIVHAFLMIIYYTLLAIGLWKKQPQ